MLSTITFKIDCRIKAEGRFFGLTGYYWDYASPGKQKMQVNLNEFIDIDGVTITSIQCSCNQIERIYVRREQSKYDIFTPYGASLNVKRQKSSFSKGQRVKVINDCFYQGINLLDEIGTIVDIDAHHYLNSDYLIEFDGSARCWVIESNLEVSDLQPIGYMKDIPEANAFAPPITVIPNVTLTEIKPIGLVDYAGQKVIPPIIKPLPPTGTSEACIAALGKTIPKQAKSPKFTKGQRVRHIGKDSMIGIVEDIHNYDYSVSIAYFVDFGNRKSYVWENYLELVQENCVTGDCVAFIDSESGFARPITMKEVGKAIVEQDLKMLSNVDIIIDSNKEMGCTCDIMVLMASGCKCGHLKKG